MIELSYQKKKKGGTHVYIEIIGRVLVICSGWLGVAVFISKKVLLIDNSGLFVVGNRRIWVSTVEVDWELNSGSGLVFSGIHGRKPLAVILRK